jgi:hypothetical protein
MNYETGRRRRPRRAAVAEVGERRAPSIDEGELDQAEARARDAAAVVPAALQAGARAAADVPRLTAEIRRLRERLGMLRSENAELAQQAKAASGRPAPAAPPARHEPAESELATLMSAPFRVDARAQSAARTDPLAALAVQVARALADDAREIERARLIAMAFAAARGDLDAFWQARRQRARRAKDAKGP